MRSSRQLPANTGVKPLSQRRFDLFVVAFFLMHIPVTAIVDSQIGGPPEITQNLQRMIRCLTLKMLAPICLSRTPLGVACRHCLKAMFLHRWPTFWTLHKP